MGKLRSSFKSRVNTGVSGVKQECAHGIEEFGMSDACLSAGLSTFAQKASTEVMADRLGGGVELWTTRSRCGAAASPAKVRIRARLHELALSELEAWGSLSIEMEGWANTPVPNFQFFDKAQSVSYS